MKLHTAITLAALVLLQRLSTQHSKHSSLLCVGHLDTGCSCDIVQGYVQWCIVQPFNKKSSTTSLAPGFGNNKRLAPNVKFGAPGTPTKSSWGAAPSTPSPSYSHLVLPASSGLPAMPVGGQEMKPTSPGFGLMEGIPTMHPSKPKMFTFAAPSGWQLLVWTLLSISHSFSIVLNACSFDLHWTSSFSTAPICCCSISK